MGWRNQESHREETKAVKAALKRAGIKFAKVGHGSGTAWGWLHIELAAPWDRETNSAKSDEATSVAQATTGRHGDYDGRILVEFSA